MSGSEITALFKRLMKIHSNRPTLDYGFKPQMDRNLVEWATLFKSVLFLFKKLYIKKIC